MIKTNASDLAKGGILNHLEPDRKWHLLAYLSKCSLPAEINNDIYDKEIVVIMNCFER